MKKNLEKVDSGAGMNKYDYIIILTIISIIFVGEVFRAFHPIKIIGFVASFYFLFTFNKWKGFFLRKNKKLVSFFFFWLAYSAASVLWVGDSKNYIISALTLYCFVFVFLLIFSLSQLARDPIGSIVKGWMIFLVLNLICAFGEIITGEHFSSGSFQADDIERDISGVVMNKVYAAVTYGNYNSFSVLLCLTLLFLLLYIYSKPKIISQLFGILLFFCVCIILIINTSRGSLISLFLFIIPLWYAIRKMKGIKYLFIASLFIIGIYLWIGYADDIIFLLEKKLDARSGGASSDPRWILWNAGLDIASQWMFLGSGTGSMMYEYKLNHVFILYAHNLWIQMLLEYGIVTTLCFICFYLRLTWKSLFSSDSLLKIIGLYLLFAWPVLTIIDEEYLKSFHFVFFASVYSIFYCRKYCQKNDPVPERVSGMG
ncbi:O-antigen ligase family protein [Alistipes sp.]|uniref:O-antigen ligase family protein n=1 Tax=Alistipes sp. TaxID=1872444 RepID=UPI0025BE1B8D|nr:O-antigen ligase family protein [Alistipes sp.]